VARERGAHSVGTGAFACIQAAGEPVGVSASRAVMGYSGRYSRGPPRSGGGGKDNGQQKWSEKVPRADLARRVRCRPCDRAAHTCT